MSLTVHGRPIDWTNVVYLTVLHLGVLLAPWTFSWPALGLSPRSCGCRSPSASA